MCVRARVQSNSRVHIIPPRRPRHAVLQSDSLDLLDVLGVRCESCPRDAEKISSWTSLARLAAWPAAKADDHRSVPSRCAEQQTVQHLVS